LAFWNILHPFQVILKRRERKLAYVSLASFEFPHFFPSLLLHRLFQGSVDTLASLTELTRAQEVKHEMVLASAHEDVEGLVQKVTLLKGELAEARRAWEVAEEQFYSLSNASGDGAWRLVVSKMEHREQFEELSFLWAQGTELCPAIVGPSWVRNHLSERMQATAIRHTEMAGELAMLRVVVTSIVELVLGCSPDETFWVEIIDELVQF
jgi:hypothetical protein